jgi:hypothetical protein
MAQKFEILKDDFLKITDTVSGLKKFLEPKANFFFRIEDLNSGNIKIYATQAVNRSASIIFNSEIGEAIDGSDVVFTAQTFEDFCTDNRLGFKAASGGSGALLTVTGDGTTTINWGSFGLVNFQFGASDEVFTFTAPSKAGTFLLKLTQDSVGSRTATFPANVKYTEGIQPTLSTTATTGTDILTFYFDGTNFLAVEALNFS